MNKIRIIDLLNKIANGEEVPKKIKYDNDIWKYDELSRDYEMFDDSGDLYLFGEELNITLVLNDEVEIIEEDKKIEKLFTGGYDTISDTTLANKINEIIDVVNKLKEEE